MGEKRYIFIDESGSPDFFGKRKRPLWLGDNYQPILLLGMVATDKRVKLRKVIESFQHEILNDSLYNTIFSVRQPNWFLHAKDDHPEVRIKFFERIREMSDLEFYIIIARKIPELFIQKHNGNAKEFYFDVLNNLIQYFPFERNFKYQFFLARRDKQNIKAFVNSIEKVIDKLTTMKLNNEEEFCHYQCDVVKAAIYPEMSVVDYVLWAVQRYITKKDRRYLNAIEDKVKLIYDVYDDNASDNLYQKGNPFTLEKAKNFFT